jgi:hypothetical protein
MSLSAATTADASQVIEFNQIRETTLKLLHYCQDNNWAGYDPYDALNSRLLKWLPFLNFKYSRIALTQFNKRSPINFRPLLLIPKAQNPKGLALFLTSLIKLARLGMCKEEDAIDAMVARLAALKSPNTAYWCWGYSFPWQTRTILVPHGAPNLVCTTFVANALLDAYEHTGATTCLDMAVSAAEYLLSLYWTDGANIASFSYPLPNLSAQVHNANFLAAALLCRVSRLNGNTRLLEHALKAARYSAGKQFSDGSWDYGEGLKQKWKDNFHTGFNLCALQAIGRHAATAEFESPVRRGIEFYRAHFIREDGAPRYFHNRTYPIDIHSAAQTILTLLSFADPVHEDARLADRVFRWTMTHMWNAEGYFSYRILPLIAIRTSFMRWSQAWMMLAIAALLERQCAPLPSAVEEKPPTTVACP